MRQIIKAKETLEKLSVDATSKGGGYLMKGNDSLVGARICRNSLAHVQGFLFGK